MLPIYFRQCRVNGGEFADSVELRRQELLFLCIFIWVRPYISVSVK